MSLWSMRSGDTGIIEDFLDSLPENFRIRLSELGFHPGETVHCVKAPALGAPKLYRLNNTTFSLDKEIASQVQLKAQARVQS